MCQMTKTTVPISSQYSGGLMKSLFKACAARVTVVLMGLASFSAQAEILPLDYVTAVFSGNCIDCAAAAGTPSYNVTATLVMRDVWPEQYSTKVQLSNFVSFSYGGSNLLDPYEITEADVTYFSGVWNTFNPYLYIGKGLGDGTTLLFGYVWATFTCSHDSCDDGSWTEDRNGPWSIGISPYSSDDYGDGGTWQVVSAGNNVPEPASALLLGAALLALVLTRRQVKLQT